jgi:predicted acetyltransferase
VSIEIRQAVPDDYPAVIDTMSTGFLERPDIGRIAAEAAAVWDPGRTWMAVDGQTVCGTFRSWPTELTVPGLGGLPAAAVAGVGVLPTYRRRGILSRLAAAEHDALRERGEALALLYASEYAIYGRFGYGPATRWATWTIDTMRTGIVPGELAGGVELVRPDEAVRDAIKGLYDAWRRTSVAEIRRREFTWDRRLGLVEDPWDAQWKGWIVLHRDATGTLDGFLRYNAEPSFSAGIPRNRLVVQDLFGTTEEAERALWAQLIATDLVVELRAIGRSIDDRIQYRLTNPRAAAITEHADGMWVRMFDVPRALEARRYERTGSIVLDVVDDAATGGRWRLALDGSPDGARCIETDASPDLTIPVAALGSVYLGGHDLRDVVLRTGADEHREGALADAAALFRTAREPWTSTFF